MNPRAHQFYRKLALALFLCFATSSSLALAQLITPENEALFNQPSYPASSNLYLRLGFSEQVAPLFDQNPDAAKVLIYNRARTLISGIKPEQIISSNPQLQSALRGAAFRVQQAYIDASAVLANPAVRARGTIKNSPASEADIELLVQHPNEFGYNFSFREPVTGKMKNVEVAGARSFKLDPVKMGTGIRKGTLWLGRQSTMFGGSFAAFTAALGLQAYLNCLYSPETSPLCMQDFVKAAKDPNNLLTFFVWYGAQQGTSWGLLKMAEAHPGSRSFIYSPSFRLAAGLWAGFAASTVFRDIWNSQNVRSCARDFIHVSPGTVFTNLAHIQSPSQLTQAYNMLGFDAAEQEDCDNAWSEMGQHAVYSYIPNVVSVTGSALALGLGNYLLFNRMNLSGRLIKYFTSTRAGRNILKYGDRVVIAGYEFSPISRTFRIAAAVGSYVTFFELIGGSSNLINNWIISENRAYWGLDHRSVYNSESDLLRSLADLKYNGIHSLDDFNQRQDILKSYVDSLQLWRAENMSQIINLGPMYTQKVAPMMNLAALTYKFYQAALEREALLRLGSVPADAKNYPFVSDYKLDDQKFVQDFYQHVDKVDSGLTSKFIDSFNGDAKSVAGFSKTNILDYMVAMMACGPDVRIPNKYGVKESVISTFGGMMGWAYHFTPPRLLQNRPSFCNGRENGDTIYSFKWNDEKGVQHQGLLSYVMHNVPSSILNLNEQAPVGHPLGTLDRVLQPHDLFWNEEIRPQLNDINQIELNNWEKYIRESGLKLYATHDYKYCTGGTAVDYNPRIDSGLPCTLTRRLAYSSVYSIADETRLFSHWIVELATPLALKYKVDLAPLQNAQVKVELAYVEYLKGFDQIVENAKDNNSANLTITQDLANQATLAENVVNYEKSFSTAVSDFTSAVATSPLFNVNSPDTYTGNFLISLSMRDDDISSELMDQMTFVVPQFAQAMLNRPKK